MPQTLRSLMIIITANLPASIQTLLKLCKEGGEDCDTMTTELLQEMGVSPITSTGIEDTPAPVQSSGGNSAAAVGQKDEEEVPTNHKNPLNEIWHGETVLHIAAASGNERIIPILLLHGANPAIK